MNTIQLFEESTATQPAKLLDTAKAHTTGGRERGASLTSEGRLDVKFSLPNGPDDGTNLGVVEVVTAILIALRPFSPKTSAIGSVVAVLMSLTTLSFPFSTPGREPSVGGFPALSGSVGQFLLKDVVLLGAAVWSLGEALSAVSIAAHAPAVRLQGATAQPQAPVSSASNSSN